jgi:hypothetical protein
MSAPPAIAAVTTWEPDVLNTLNMLRVGESGTIAIPVYPAPGVKLLEEETPQEAKSAAPDGLMVALTVPLLAYDPTTGPSATFDPPVVE